MDEVDYSLEYRRREEERERMRREMALAEAPILTDLHAAGVEVGSVLELASRKRRQDIAPAIPILIDWLSRTEHLGVKYWIADALRVPVRRREVVPALIRAFEADYPQESADFLKSTIAWSLAVAVDSRYFDDVHRLVKERSHGRSRQWLVDALGKMKEPKAVRVLLDLLDDEEVAHFALAPLAKLNAQEARPRIERFLQHKEAWVRRAAQRALDRLDKAAGLPIMRPPKKIRRSPGPRKPLWYEWWQSPEWNAEIQELIEVKLKRARPENRANYLSSKAYALLQSGDQARMRTAVALYERVISEYPDRFDQASDHEGLGQTYAALGQYKEAEEQYRLALDWYKRRPNIRGLSEFHYAELILKTEQKDKYPEALTVLQGLTKGDSVALVFNSLQYRFYMIRARLRAGLGQGREAAQDAWKVLQLAKITEPQLPHKPTIGLIETNPTDLKEMRRLADLTK